MKKAIPSILTATNLLCGFWAILVNDPFYSFFLIMVGICFDFMDGLTARALKVQSLFGKEFDSMADMVSFGVVPGFLFYHHIISPFENPSFSFFGGLLAATLIPICAGLRLAKFNVHDGDKKYFSGLPSSAAAFFVISLIFMKSIRQDISMLENPILVVVLPLLVSLLMVTKVPMFGLKDMKGGLKRNMSVIIYIILSIPLIFLVKWYYLPISIILYIMISIVMRKSFVV
jgi:CDP-diacylglycerol--serine O-phosphatidyltransferase